MKYSALLLMVLLLLGLAYFCLVKSHLIQGVAIRSIAPGNLYYDFVRSRNYLVVIRLIGLICLIVSCSLMFIALCKVL